MKRSFKRGKKGGRKGNQSGDNYGVLVWKGRNCFPMAYMCKHQWVGQWRDTTTVATALTIQAMILDITSPYQDVSSTVVTYPRGVEILNMVYSVWQVVGYAYELRFTNLSTEIINLTVFPTAGQNADNVLVDTWNEPGAQNRSVLSAEDPNGSPFVVIKGYVNVKKLAGRSLQTDLTNFQGTAIGFGDGPIEDWRLNIVQNTTSGTALAWDMTLSATYYVKWTEPKLLNPGNVPTSDAFPDWKSMYLAETNPRLGKIYRRRHLHSLEDQCFMKVIEEKAEEEGEDMEDISAPSSTVALTQNVHSMHFKTPRRRILPTYLGDVRK